MTVKSGCHATTPALNSLPRQCPLAIGILELRPSVRFALSHNFHRAFFWIALISVSGRCFVQ
jgi:hypothetical protein